MSRQALETFCKNLSRILPFEGLMSPLKSKLPARSPIPRPLSSSVVKVCSLERPADGKEI